LKAPSFPYQTFIYPGVGLDANQQVDDLISGVREAVVLAGGEGTRLRPLTNNRPKPLLPVLGRPCIEYSLRALSSAGIEVIDLACAYKGKEVVNQLGDGKALGLNIEYAFEETPMGTAGAVKLLERKLPEVFVVVMGDTLMDIDFEKVIRFHQEHQAMITIALTEVSNPSEYGIVGLDHRSRIVRFREKPVPAEAFSNLINAGVYVIQREAFRFVPEATKFDFSKNLFPKLMELGHPLYGVKLQGMWKDIGRPRDLLDANLQMAERRGSERSFDGVASEGKICASSFSGKGASIFGPAYLGERVILGEGVVIASSAIGGGTKIDAGVNVTDSLMLESCLVMKGSRMIGSIVGQGCRIGPGVSLSNCVLGDGVTIEGPIELEGRTLDKSPPLP
jgi:mannose-1-phosphate guanylyltransferase